jgi:hypothetical protein
MDIPDMKVLERDIPGPSSGGEGGLAGRENR